jgi:opacity protein-like surface antigen
MKRMLTFTSLALIGLMAAAPADAQSNPWSVSFDLGSQVAASGDLHGGGSGTVLSLPTLVESRSYGDIYGNGFYWAAGVGYRVGNAGEIRIQGSYTSNPADRLQVGTVATLPLFALFDDYKAFGMDFGYRQYLATGMARPFVGGSVGFVRLSQIQSEFTVPAAGVVLPNVDMYDSSVVPAFGAGGGVQINLSDRFAVQGGIEFKWHGDAADVDGLAGTGLESINDQSRRWAMPITGGVTVRF